VCVRVLHAVESLSVLLLLGEMHVLVRRRGRAGALKGVENLLQGQGRLEPEVSSSLLLLVFPSLFIF
jgi:hypothetical protein